MGNVSTHEAGKHMPHSHNSSICVCTVSIQVTVTDGRQVHLMCAAALKRALPLAQHNLLESLVTLKQQQKDGSPIPAAASVWDRQQIAGSIGTPACFLAVLP